MAGSGVFQPCSSSDEMAFLFVEGGGGDFPQFPSPAAGPYFFLYAVPESLTSGTKFLDAQWAAAGEGSRKLLPKVCNWLDAMLPSLGLNLT